MFVDASALTAVLTSEEDARELVARLRRGRQRMTSPLAVWETAVAVARIQGVPVRDAAEVVDRFLGLARIEVVAVPAEAAAVAIDAFERFGKGRHPAGLNFGDCFAYACARIHGRPLMFKGGDFAQTDIEAA